MSVMVNSVIHSDAIELMQKIESDSIQMIFADPPYGIGYHSNHYKGRNPHSPILNDWDFHIGNFLEECSRVLAPGGVLYLCCRWDISPIWIPYIPPGLKLKTIIAWVKDNWSAGDIKGSFGNQYEQILFIAKGRNIIRGKRYPNVWNYPRVPAKKLLHPTQKPVELVERAIESSTNPGDIVLDVFSGSGTTGLAAKNTGRKFIMGDIDINMVKLSSNRVGIPFEWEIDKKKPQSNSGNIELATFDAYGIHPEDIHVVLDYISKNAAESFD